MSAPFVTFREMSVHNVCNSCVVYVLHRPNVWCEIIAGCCYVVHSCRLWIVIVIPFECDIQIV